MVKGSAGAAACAVIAFFLIIPSTFCVAAASFEGSLAYLEGLGPRLEGSKGEAEAFDFVEASLREMGLSPSSGNFDDVSEGYSKSRIVEALVRGERADELAIVVPVGSWIDSPDGAEGAFGLALALEEAAALSAGARAGETPPISIRFVFLGAEKRGRRAEGGIAALGSRTWIARQEGRARLAVIYLDAPFPPSRIELRSAGRGVLSPYWYYEGMRRALDASGIDYGIQANRQEAYRLGLAGDFGPAAPYLEAGIPAIELKGLPQAAELPGGREGRAWFPSAIGLFAKGKAGGFPETWDRHYFIIEFGRIVGVLREKSYVAILLGLVALVALSILVETVARRQTVKSLVKRLPAMSAQVLTLFIAQVAVVFVGKGLAQLEAAVLGSAKAWTLLPGVFAVSRILFFFLLFLALLSRLVDRRILTPNPYFYEFTGLICLAIDVFVFSIVDLSASFYFIWALVVVEASLAIRRRLASIFAYAIMYFPLLIVAGELLRRPDLAAYGKLIAPDFLGVLTFAALSLPFFVFTASPLLLVAPPGAPARRRLVALFAALALASELVALASFRIAVPSLGPGRSDLELSETIDQDSGRFELWLSGAQRLGRGSISRGGMVLAYDEPGETVHLSGEDRKRRIGIEENRSPFLDRVDEKIRVSFDSPPYSLEFVLESEGEMLLYDCSLPNKVSVDGRSATIYGGVNPGKELSFSITVPESFKSELTVRARYLGPLEPCSQSSGTPLRYTGLTVEASRGIGVVSGSERPGGSGN
jgi:hypothetical protein